MKKLSKKKRQTLKEETERKENTKKNMKQGEPFSSHKTRVCMHYTMFGGGIIAGTGMPKLMKVGDKYVCRECHHEFSEKQKLQIDKLIDYLCNSGCCLSSSRIDELMNGVEPIAYYYSDAHTIVEEGIEKCIPRMTCVMTD